MSVVITGGVLARNISKLQFTFRKPTHWFSGSFLSVPAELRHQCTQPVWDY